MRKGERQVADDQRLPVPRRETVDRDQQRASLTVLVRQVLPDESERSHDILDGQTAQLAIAQWEARHSAQDGHMLFNKILKVTDRYLDAALDFMGVVPEDEYLRKAVQKQRAVVEAYPRSKSAMAFKKLASKADSWPVPASAGGQLEFFVERLIMASQQ